MKEATLYGTEYRWEYLHFGQGHYFLASSLEEAIQIASKHATEDVVVLQQWKPKGDEKYAFLPPRMRRWKKDRVIKFYSNEGFDEALITRALEPLKALVPASV